MQQARITCETHVQAVASTSARCGPFQPQQRRQQQRESLYPRHAQRSAALSLAPAAARRAAGRRARPSAARALRNTDEPQALLFDCDGVRTAWYSALCCAA